MATEYRNKSFTGNIDHTTEKQVAQEEDIQTSTDESFQQTNASEVYETIETTTTNPEVDSKRCEAPRKSMVYAFRIIVTATVIGTLTGVVILFESNSRTIDGNWASWYPWSPCDVACDNGTQTRTRTCTDPVPSNGGLDCTGSNTDTEPCFRETCPDGGWSDWGQWGTCTVTCGDGIQTRSRACINPRPSALGMYCEGDPLEVISCNNVTCSLNIVFKARNVTDTRPIAGQAIIFGIALVNQGNAYNTSTGIFTAPVNGTYAFSTQFCVYALKGLYISIIVDGAIYATARIRDTDAHSCDTADTVAVLHAQSTVWVKCTSVYGTNLGAIIVERALFMNSFSGYLVH